jgi:PIN domain nuclease of toxin-antitoxin system
VKDGFTFLPIQNTHIEAYQSVKLFDNHRDPFDRLLIATAFKESIPIITADTNFNLYSKIISIIW